MKLKELLKKYIIIFMFLILLICFALYINSKVNNVENEINIEIIESRNMTNGEVSIVYSDNEYKIMFYDKIYPLYTSPKVYPDYRYTDEKIENKVSFSNIIEYGDSLVIEIYQDVETVDLYNYLYFYNGELVVQDYMSKSHSYDTKYFDNMYAMNGELNGLQIFNLATGETVHKTLTQQGNIVEVGKSYICFDDDTFINLNSTEKKLERAWVYLENETKDEKKLNEYKELDKENPWVFAFDECNESGDLVYSVHDYIDGVVESIYTIYISLK